MSNLSKNLLLGLTFVCVVVLIVFCIQLIVINRGVDPADPGSGVSSSQQGDEDPDAEGDGEEIQNGEGEDDPQGTQTTERPSPQGTRRALGITPYSQLIIYSREELFDFEERDLDWWFLYTGGGVATLEVSYTMITPLGVEAHAESFLNDYTGGTEAEFTGEEAIAGSDLMGYHVTAMYGESIYEAWIHVLQDSDLALVFVIHDENNQQEEALIEMLSTIEIISAGTIAPDPDTHAPTNDEEDEEDDGSEPEDE